MVQQLIITLSAILALSSCKILDFEYQPEVATSSEKLAVIDAAMSYEITPYLLGGDSAAGIDCSGLIIASMNSNGFYVLVNSKGYARDVSANDLFEFNTYDVLYPETGDLIFFDADNDGIQEHVSIFLSWSDSGNPIVYDAYSVSGYVSTREVYNYLSKNPSFGELIIYR